MSATADLRRGRESFARRGWSDAYTTLRDADAAAPLSPGDLEMYATASAGKHNLVSGLEATPIDYNKAEDLLERVRALTDDGVDAVFDPIGGAHVARSFGTLRWGGRLVGYGLSSGPRERRQPCGPRRNDLQPDSFVEHPTQR